jgi:L-arabinose isomerase
MKENPRIGLLPFYLKLYDDVLPDARSKFDGFLSDVADAFRAHGVEVKTAPVCRVADEFRAAVKEFENADVDCIVTLHLAYSPSLESVEAFCNTNLPVIILDTTMDADFGLDVSPDRIMFNHGVHGVMDFASMLCRRGMHFEIVAGHYKSPETIARAVDLARAACAARSMRTTKALRIGKLFAGMGDFVVDENVMVDKLGIHADEVGIEALDEAVLKIQDDEVEKEFARDRDQFICDVNEETHKRSIRVGLGLRRLLDEGGYQAVSVNFEAFDSPDRPASTMPFLEISKAMARGIGYAGEGDLLTAAMVGALARAFDAVTFTEIFCVDWSGNTLFLSHMGEINPAVALGTPRIFENPFTFGGGLETAVLTCAVRPGPAVFVNLAPGPCDKFSLIVAPVEVLPEDDSLDPAMLDTIRTWVRPTCNVEKFLEAYSCAGGTHHSALVLGDQAKAIAAFGRMCNMEIVSID